LQLRVHARELRETAMNLRETYVKPRGNTDRLRERITDKRTRTVKDKKIR
jgi:hypothetical protein